jgi:UDPglucose 6-dehydrogenase
VGSGDMVEKIILSHGVDPSKFDVVSNPEFLREGSAIHDTLHPDRIVIGAKKREAAVKLVDLYATLQSRMIVTDLNSAELIKYGANSFLAMKISFINAMSRVCELCNANVADVAAGIGSDTRIGNQFLSAGLGWGGSCFPKDVQGMVQVSKELGYNFNLLKEVIGINDDQTLHFLRRMEDALGGFEGKRIALMGLAFKPNTDDIRDAKSLVMIDYIRAKGGSVVAYDPVAEANVREIHPNIEFAGSVFELGEEADAIVLVTEWNEFKQLDLERLGKPMKRRILFDGRRVYDRVKAERAGFEYYTIGSK